MIPTKIKTGDTLRIVCPSRSLAIPWISDAIKDEAKRKLEALDLKVTFGKHVMEINEVDSSSINSRVSDIHDAFKDKSVKIILTAIGGYNTNEILPYLNFKLIKNNPKILCGYSDITALQNAIFAKTGLVTYSGPHFFDFGEKKDFDYTLDYFKKCFFNTKPYELKPSEKWSNDRWGKDQDNRNFFENTGFYTINKGEAKGTILGGNLVTFQSILGSEYRPRFKNSILFIEEDYGESLFTFNRNITSLTLQPDFNEVKGIVFGRFQPESKIGKKEVELVIKNNPRLHNIPIIGGLDFGHTTPRLTFSIGGKVFFSAGKKVKIEILEH